MRSIVLVIGLSCLLAAAQAAPDRPVRVLFVGNSYTAINDLPRLVVHLAASEQPPRAVETAFVGEGGATLKRHWDAGRALAEIRRGHFDYVVLQDQGALGHYDDGATPPRIADPDLFRTYARRFDEEIRKVGAKTLLFMTWARLDAPHTQETLARAYTDTGRELGAMVAPAGIAWQLALAERTRITLHDTDRSHPAAAGSYLAACTIYAALFARSPEGLSAGLLGAEEAAFLQRIAWRSVSDPSARAPLRATPGPTHAAPSAATASGSDERGLAVFAAAQRALGGAERLRTLRDYIFEMATRVRTPMGTMTLEARETFIFPAVMRSETRTPMGEMITFFDGREGWRRTPQGVQDMSERLKRITRAQSIRNTLNLMRGAGEFTVRHEGRESVAGSEADVIAVAKDGEALTLVVDTATGNLIAKRYRGVGTGGGADIEERYFDYREVAGLRVPFRFETLQNGAPFMDGTLREIRFDSAPDAAELGRRPQEVAAPSGG